jgi:glycosyltransferase involved in cell wall biosynthesis
MNVLILTNNRQQGGTVRILQSWLRLAPSEGVHGFVVTYPDSDFRQWLDAHGIPRAESAMPWPNRYAPWTSLAAAWRLARWARRDALAIVNCNEHDGYAFATLLRYILDRPMVCHMRYRLDPKFAEWTFGRRRPDALLWTSRQQRADTGDAAAGLVPEDRQHLIPLGLDLTQFGLRTETRATSRRAWGAPDDAIVIGQCTALRPRKRLEDFVDLVTRLAARNPRVMGVLAGDAPPGDEPYRARLLEQIKDSGLGDRFRWLGHIDDVEPFHQGIDMFVSTSDYETFGNSVCEAMACSRPVVAYVGGSVREVVGDSGRIVETGDVAALIAAARECVEDDALRAELGRLARQRVADEFSPLTSLRRLTAIYANLLRSAR